MSPSPGTSWPRGFTSAGVACGIKDGGALDLGLLASDKSCAWAGTFTQNGGAAAPVRWSRSRRRVPVRGVVVNSGNANACTGSHGEDAVKQTASAVASALGADTGEVLVASTGPIGFRLPVEKIVDAVPRAARSLHDRVDDFAASIMTTDTVPKTSTSSVGDARVVGVAKGAAMLAPNMATMLAFVATDAGADQDVLQDGLSRAVDSSFNSLSVDGCESTNDSVILLSSGAAGRPDEADLWSALTKVCCDLAEQMADDAEGGSKLVRIRVRGTGDSDSARRLGRAVAASALWRAALFGSDPNWGRIVAALGAEDRRLDPLQLSIAIGAETVLERGEPAGSLEAAAEQMKGGRVVVDCTVGGGSGEAEVLTADLSPSYVELNAYGTS